LRAEFTFVDVQSLIVKTFGSLVVAPVRIEIAQAIQSNRKLRMVLAERPLVEIDSVFQEPAGFTKNTGIVTVIDGNDNSTLPPIPVGSNPVAVLVNPVTDKIYVANLDAGSVTVLAGVTPIATVTVTGGSCVVSGPIALSLNAVTNSIYVANDCDNTVTVINGDDNTPSSTIAIVGTSPNSVAVNAVTNKAYTSNVDNTVSIIDGATYRQLPAIPIPLLPTSLAVNPVTNKTYVTDGSTIVTVIGDDSIIGIPVVANATALAVNPVTNKTYVATGLRNSVTVINGADNSTSPPIPVGTNPTALAVNPVTNKTYVASSGSNTVTVINGADNSTSPPIPVATHPTTVAVNPVTNKIYVASVACAVDCVSPGTVTVINGSDNSTSPPIPVGFDPVALVVNPATNRIYVVNQDSDTVTVINGSDNTSASISVGTGAHPTVAALDPSSNNVYVADSFASAISVISGNVLLATVPTGMAENPLALTANPATSKIYAGTDADELIAFSRGTDFPSAKIPLPGKPISAVVNPVTNIAYIATNDFISRIEEQQVHPIPLTVTIAPLPGNVTGVAQPVFTFQAQSSYSPIAPAPQTVYFQFDTWQGAWQKAVGTGSVFSGTPAAPLALGTHILYAFAGDGQEATSIGVSNINIGSIQAYVFTVINPVVIPPEQFNTPVGTNVQVTLPPVTLTFAQVTVAGNSRLQTSSAGSPSGYRPGASNSQVRYDLVTTAAVTGLLTVCVDTPDVQGFIKPNRARMFVMSALPDPSGRVPDVTTSLSPANTTETLPAFDSKGKALPARLTGICGQVSAFPPNTTLSLAVFEPNNHPPAFASLQASTPALVTTISKGQNGQEQAVTQMMVGGEQDTDLADPCILAGGPATCSDRPFVKTFAIGFFPPSPNCPAGCNTIDISDPKADPAAMLQLFATTQSQTICVAVLDQTIGLSAVASFVNSTQCIGSPREISGFAIGGVMVQSPLGLQALIGPTSATVTAGQAFSTVVLVAPGTSILPTAVSISCDGPPGAANLTSAGISCLVPAQVMFPKSANPTTQQAVIQLFVQTTGRTVSATPAGRGPFPYGLLDVCATVFLACGLRRTRPGKRNRKKLVWGTAAAVLLGLVLSCGGGQSGRNAVAGTPSGTYKVVIRSTSPNVTFQPPNDNGVPPASTYTFTLTVQ
jgi:YVTN family beta-propeller protein